MQNLDSKSEEEFSSPNVLHSTSVLCIQKALCDNMWAIVGSLMSMHCNSSLLFFYLFTDVNNKTQMVLQKYMSLCQNIA